MWLTGKPSWGAVKERIYSAGRCEVIGHHGTLQERLEGHLGDLRGVRPRTGRALTNTRSGVDAHAAGRQLTRARPPHHGGRDEGEHQ